MHKSNVISVLQGPSVFCEYFPELCIVTSNCRLKRVKDVNTSQANTSKRVIAVANTRKAGESIAVERAMSAFALTA